ncbi:hypothetical protein M427DRAFT_143104 [Gonapodya prolifera JEL478]|uniref:Rho GTPase activation protein n=1 Tax=Gonapodya prolifera (strain JEL478) TaxID=1344416 RepID=A0A139ASU2_GONPJ|nr:hypothetical protein M427DRAFT_143104 [Gonapodya prolifera JEL478]|eukprot:KXS19801.1 hypothetical protein M427DRAFT_143104 [Gonapodya prolifera JEL478]
MTFESVSEYSDASLRASELVLGFLQKRMNIETEYSKSLAKLAQSYPQLDDLLFTRMTKQGSGNALSSFLPRLASISQIGQKDTDQESSDGWKESMKNSALWMGFKDLVMKTDQLAITHRNVALGIESTVGSLESYVRQFDENRKAMVECGLSFQMQLQDHYTELKKAKTQAQDLQQKMNSLKEKSDSTRPEQQSSKTQLKTAATQEKLEEAIRAMQIAEAAATEAQARYFAVSMPTLLGKFAVEEERRSLTVKNSLLEFHRTVKFYQEVQTRIIDSLGDMLNNIDVKDDLDSFLEMHVNTEELQDHKISVRNLMNPRISGRVELCMAEDESWKPRFMVLMGEEKRLYCFLAEDSNRPKFVALYVCRFFTVKDLSRRNQVSVVDDSLFGKPNCFHIVIDSADFNDFKTPSELAVAAPRAAVIYICADTDSLREQWVKAIREMSVCCEQCAEAALEATLSRRNTSTENKPAPSDAVGYKTTRSLDIKVLEAKDIVSGAPADVYCVVLLNDLRQAKTRPCHGSNPFWGESYIFEEVPPCARKLRFVLYCKQKLGKDQEIGFVSLNLLKLKSRHKVEEWFPVAPARGEATSENLPSLRLSIMLRNEVLAQASPKREEIAKTFVNVLIAQGKETEVVSYITSEEIRRTALDVYLKSVASEYLKSTIGSLIKTIYRNNRESLEIDPTKVSDVFELKRRWQKLLGYCGSFVTAISRSSDFINPQLRIIFQEMSKAAFETFPTTPDIQARAISSFIFLRFFCAAILSPKLFNLVNQHPDLIIGRNLTLIVKILQNLASLSLFEAKEPHMLDANAFITERIPEMREYLQRIAVPASIRVDLSREMEQLYFYFLDSLEEVKITAGKQISLLSAPKADETKKTNRSQFLFYNQEPTEVGVTMSRLYSALADLQQKHEEWDTQRRHNLSNFETSELTSPQKSNPQLMSIKTEVSGSGLAQCEDSPSIVPNDDISNYGHAGSSHRHPSRSRMGGMMIRDSETGKLLGAVVPSQHVKSVSVGTAALLPASPITAHTPNLQSKPRKSSANANGDFAELYRLFEK